MDKENKEKSGNIFEKFKTKRKLKRMDRLWELYGGSCFGLFPPSFYHKHSEEEIEEMQRREIAKLKEKLDDFIMRNENKA